MHKKSNKKLEIYHVVQKLNTPLFFKQIIFVYTEALISEKEEMYLILFYQFNFLVLYLLQI